MFLPHIWIPVRPTGSILAEVSKLGGRNSSRVVHIGWSEYLNGSVESDISESTLVSTEMICVCFHMYIAGL